MDGFQINLGSETTNAEVVKGLVLQELHRQELLTQEQVDEFSRNYGIVFVKKAWYSRIWSKGGDWVAACVRLSNDED